MADLTLTVANIALTLEKGSARFEILQAGEAIAAGDMVYKDATDSSKAKKAQAGDSAGKEVHAFAFSPAVDDGYFVALLSGPFKPGGTLVKGGVYYLSDTPSKIADGLPSSGSTVVQLFRATSTTEAVLAIDITTITVD